MKVSLRSRKSRAVFVLWMGELVLICLAVTIAAWLRFFSDPDTHIAFAQDAPIRTLLVAICTTGAMAAFGLYQVHTRHNRMDLVLRLGMSFAFGGVALLVLYYAVPATYIGRGVLAIALSLAILAVFLLRMVLQRVFEAEIFKRRVLVLGAGDNANLINSKLRRRSDRHSFFLVGFLPTGDRAVQVPNELTIRTDCSLLEVTQLMNVHEIVVAPDERRGKLPMEELLLCAQRGIAVTDLPAFFEREAGKIKLSVIDPSSLVFSGGFDHSMPRRLSKRFFDLVAAGALLALAWPAMLIVAACVWLESGSPILYRQTRVGESGASFELVKFRSMRTDAEKDGVARWANKDDDRTTARRPFHPQDAPGRAAAAVQRAAWRDEFRRAASGAPAVRQPAQPGNPLLRHPPLGEAGPDGLGAVAVSLRRVGQRCRGEAQVRPVLRQEPGPGLRPDDPAADRGSGAVRSRSALTLR